MLFLLIVGFYYCFVPALGVTFIPIVAACFQANFFLGKAQNAVTNAGNDGLPLAEEAPRSAAKPRKEAFLRFWAGT